MSLLFMDVYDIQMVHAKDREPDNTVEESDAWNYYYLVAYWESK